MTTVRDIFDHGPNAVLDWFSQPVLKSFDDMDAKRLADICWTRAGTLETSDTAAARKWGTAALAGYDHLAQHAAPMVAESAAENAAALRSWPLIAEPQPS